MTLVKMLMAGLCVSVLMTGCDDASVATSVSVGEEGGEATEEEGGEATEEEGGEATEEEGGEATEEEGGEATEEEGGEATEEGGEATEEGGEATEEGGEATEEEGGEATEEGGEATEEEGGEATEEEGGESTELLSIAATAAADPQFSTLVEAATVAGLVDTLSAPGEFTVFAPTNDAFDALPEGALDGLLGDTEALSGVLLYHAIGGVVLAEAIIELESAPTLAGIDITIEVTDEGVVLNGSVNVTATDILCSNGVIHVIDAVLLPPQPTFCESWTATCGDWMMEPGCEDWWAAAAPGTEGDTTGASQGCYWYHLGVAQAQETEEDTMMHCMHAAGDAPCVDPEPTFCESWTATCGDWMMDTSCEDWWAAAAPGTEGDTTGATQACYEYHLEVAQAQETEEDTMMHCMHAAGDAPCVEPEPMSLYDTAVDAGVFGTLLAAAEATGLTQALHGNISKEDLSGANPLACATDMTLEEIVALNGGPCPEWLTYEGCCVDGIGNAYCENNVANTSNCVNEKTGEAGFCSWETKEQFYSCYTNSADLTVFAPTDDAFAGLPEGTLDALLADTDALKAILFYHILPSVVLSESLVAEATVVTAQGKSITVEATEAGVKLNGTALVTLADLECTNGVIHVIDTVLSIPAPSGPGACIADAGFACNPMVADSCDTAAGEACDGNAPGTNTGNESAEFQCFPGPENTAKVGEECGSSKNTFCEHGLRCTDPYVNTMVNTCRTVCCSNDECGMGEVCGVNSLPQWSTVNQAYGLGVCEPEQP